MSKNTIEVAPKKINITLKLEASLVKAIKVIAAKKGVSISALMAQKLEEEVQQNGDYEQAMKRALALMKESTGLGWQKPKSRDELHER